MDIQQIMKCLPHRYPFLLLDRVLEIEPGKRIVGLKNVTVNEPFFQGHFPGVPVMPGVLIIEALAQAGAALLLHDAGSCDDKLIYITGIDAARFRRTVVPGDQLHLIMEVMRLRSRAGRLKGRAEVNGQKVAEAEILSAMVDRELP
ncbi:MAG: 3-hydroxyacyl-ACP dehydratase FabZ [Acidobacteriota bacterium]|nr:3-hydroxyacyl-ACP dehydratase FabZ [Acidobacteriota bacterium]